MKSKSYSIFGVIAAVGLLSLAAVALADTTKKFTLESKDGNRATRDIGNAYRVTLSKRLSSKPCIAGVSYGYSRSQAWVSRGCRGEFKAYYRGGNGGSGGGWGNGGSGGGWNNNDKSYTIRVESRNDEYREQSIPAGRSVTLLRTLSSKPCSSGVSWGVKYNRVWVRNGCRGEFRVSGK
jgi:hypothetical protein